MGRPITKGSTDQYSKVRFIDSGTGFPVTSIDTGAAGLALWYQRGPESNVSIIPVGKVQGGAHVDGGFVFTGDGYCQIDFPDLACADSGLNDVLIAGGATGMICIGNEHALWDIDPYNRTDAGIDVLDDIDSNVSEIVVDTRTTIPAALDNIDSNVSEIVIDTRTTIPDAIDNVDSNVSTILGQTGTTGVTLIDDAITAILKNRQPNIRDAGIPADVAVCPTATRRRVTRSVVSLREVVGLVEHLAIGAATVDDPRNHHLPAARRVVRAFGRTRFACAGCTCRSTAAPSVRRHKPPTRRWLRRLATQIGRHPKFVDCSFYLAHAGHSMAIHFQRPSAPLPPLPEPPLPLPTPSSARSSSQTAMSTALVSAASENVFST